MIIAILISSKKLKIDVTVINQLENEEMRIGITQYGTVNQRLCKALDIIDNIF